MERSPKLAAWPRRIVRWLMQIAAALVIILALLVGVARLVLPEASSFKEDIRAGVADATGFNVDFRQISAGISAYGPELRFSQTSVLWPDGELVATANAVAVSLDVIALVTRGKLAAGRIYIEGARLDTELTADGEWLVQGKSWRDYLPQERSQNLDDLPDTTLQLADITFRFTNHAREGPTVEGRLGQLESELDNDRLHIAAELDVEESYGRAIAFAADVPLEVLTRTSEQAAAEPWRLTVTAENFRLAQWLNIAQIKDFPVADSQGRIDVQLTFEGARPTAVDADVDLAQVLLLQPSGPQALVDKLAGQLQWALAGRGWEASAENFRFEREGRSWPTATISLQQTVGIKPDSQRWKIDSSFVRVDDLMPFARAFMQEQLERAGLDGNASGDMEQLGLEFLITQKELTAFAVDAEFTNAGYVSADGTLDLRGYSGRVSANEGGGTLELNTRDALFGVGQLFRETVPIVGLDGIAIWRAGPQGHRILADKIRLETPDGSANASLELTFDSELKNPVVDLNGDATLDDVVMVPRYLPKKIPAKVTEWLGRSLQAGFVPSADIRLQGPLARFPFASGEGVFEIGVNFNGGRLDYAPGWPAIEDASGRLVFDGVSMYSQNNNFTVAGIPLVDVNMRIEDLRKGELRFVDSGSIQLESLQRFLLLSPVAEKLGPVFAEVEANGVATGSFELTLPIKSLSDWRLVGGLETTGATVGLKTLQHKFEGIQGSISVNNTMIRAEGLTAELLGEPVVIDVEPLDIDTTAYSHRAFVTGVLPIAKIQQALKLPATSWLSGATAFRSQVLFPGGRGAGQSEFLVSVRSDLAGVESNLPQPLSKSVDATEGLSLDIRFPQRGVLHLDGVLQRGYGFALELGADEAEEGWDIRRGLITRSGQAPALPEESGLQLRGSIDRLDIDRWLSVLGKKKLPTLPLVTPQEPAAGWQKLFRRADVQIGELTVLGFSFVDVDAGVAFGNQAYDIRVTGPWSEGNLVVPYDFEGTSPVLLQMERLLLIEPVAAGSGNAGSEANPRDVPAFKGYIDEFALGNLRLGALEADVRRTEDGLKSKTLKTTATSFSSDMSYDWLIVDNAQRSRLHLELVSNDVANTLEQLGYTPLIRASKGTVKADLIWEGGPGMDSVYASTGRIELKIQEGVVEDVDAGGGRILGLLSVTTIPRRLSLDFKDMTKDGLIFDKIEGRFRIDFGDAWTCNLGLEGEVADMGIVGRTGITTQDYDQVAAVRPHVSNLAPVAGAFIAGPTIGVATLLVTQILKKPLSNIGETYYTLQGSWDTPEFAKVDRGGLDTTAFADCEAELPPLSPEEIQAIEELVAEPPGQPEEAPAAAPQ